MSTQNVVLFVTDYCDRMCPTCCLNLCTLLPYHDRDADQLVTDAEALGGGVATLFVSGGEPAVHAQLGRVLRGLAANRPARWAKLVLVTNGSALLRRAINDLHVLDEIRVTKFSRESYPGSADNSEDVRWLVEHCPPGPRVLVSPVVHSLRGADTIADAPCGREVHAGLRNGRLYPCCVAAFLPNTASVPVSAQWRQDLCGLPLPCGACVFAK